MLRTLALLPLLALPTSAFAQAKTGPDPKDVDAATAKAIAYLKTKQGADGGFAPKLGGPGVTALIVAGLIRSGQTDNDVVKKGLEYLEKNVKDDGGIYAKGLANYTTCLGLMAFKDANKDGKYTKIVEAATKYLRGNQNSDDEKNVNFGGTGYNGKGAADLSNVHFYIEALIAGGAKNDDPAIKRALKFISRCQNAKTEDQDQEFAGKAADDDKGGFVYNPNDGGNPKSDKRTPAGGLRSEGGMTYAGLKSFLYAGVGKDDPRVKAAIDWCRKHYSVEENPGQGKKGLFYYYHVFAKALDALGEEEFADAKGTKHDWRKELFEALKKAQKEDGSWANTDPSFGEGSPELATAFAILSLSYTKKK